eukprot:UN07407
MIMTNLFFCHVNVVMFMNQLYTCMCSCMFLCVQWRHHSCVQ